MDEETFLARVRAALKGCPPAQPPRDYQVARLVGRDADLVERFEAMAADAGMEVQRLRTADQLADAIERIVAETSAKLVYCPPEDWPHRSSALDRLRAAGCQIVERPNEEQVFAAGVGLTAASAGIAETGSLVLMSGSQRARMASLAPPVHVAVLQAADILPDLIDWAEQTKELPAHLTFITGPSKSADIEQELVTGVHGPGRVVVLIAE
jgi:L-lactate dehydrogenase complex protein LldG